GGRQAAGGPARVATGAARSQRHFQDKVGAAGAMAVRALAVRPALGVIVASVVEIEKGRQLGRGLEPDAAAVTPVSAVGAAVRDEFLAAEADAAGASVTALDEDIDLVDEHVVHRGPGRARRRSHRVGADAHEARITAP